MKYLESLALRVHGDKIFVLDQTKLPHQEDWLEPKTIEDMVECIVSLRVRGAPLIGVAASCSIAQFARKGASAVELKNAISVLKKSRPTAVNLMNALERFESILEKYLKTNRNKTEMVEEIMSLSEEIFQEDVALCEAIATNGVDTVCDGDGILTHCNTGGLATTGIGTALGVIRRAYELGRRVHVYVDETRPLFQGARLTAWECSKLGIPYTLICDHMSSVLMKEGRIQKIYVGADRIAMNGDTANKIGTYTISILAKNFNIPFYVAAPITTLDFKCKTGKEIPIEERDPNEVRLDKAPQTCKVFNPAFDVTPSENITAFILDQGLFTVREFLDTFSPS